MKSTSSGFNFKLLSAMLLLVVLTTGCMTIPDNPDSLGIWGDIATMPIPDGIFDPVFEIVGALVVVVAAAWYYFSNNEGREVKVTFFIVAATGLSVLNLILSTLRSAAWPPEYSFSFIWKSLGWPFDGPLSMWAIGWTIITAFILFGLQLIIIIKATKNLLVSSRHFEPDRMLDDGGLILGLLLFPWFHFGLVKLLASIGPSLFGPMAGEVANWFIPTAGVYLVSTLIMQYLAFIWMPREFSRRYKAAKMVVENGDKNSAERAPRGIDPDTWAVVAAFLAGMWQRDGTENAEARAYYAGLLSTGHPPINGEPPPGGPRPQLGSGPIWMGSRPDQTGPPGSGKWTPVGVQKDPKTGDTSVVWRDPEGNFIYRPQGFDPNNEIDAQFRDAGLPPAAPQKTDLPQDAVPNEGLPDTISGSALGNVPDTDTVDGDEERYTPEQLVQSLLGDLSEKGTSYNTDEDDSGLPASVYQEPEVQSTAVESQSAPLEVREVQVQPASVEQTTTYTPDHGIREQESRNDSSSSVDSGYPPSSDRVEEVVTPPTESRTDQSDPVGHRPQEITVAPHRTTSQEDDESGFPSAAPDLGG